MKSLLISSTYFPPMIGGISRFMGAITTTLGVDRVCCLTRIHAEGTTVGNGLGPRIYRQPLAFRTKHLRAAVWGMTLVKILLQEQPRVVQLSIASEGISGLWLRKWFKLPFVIYAHGNEILQVLQGAQDQSRLALQQADCVLAVSQYTAQLVEQVGVKSDRIEVLHPGCETDHFRPLPPCTELRHRLLGPFSGWRVIMTVGNLVPRKGHDMVIRALPYIRPFVPEVIYLIVGDGPYRTQLEDLATVMGVQDCVIFAGQVPAKDLPAIYALSDVFVMPSREQRDLCDVEGFGLVFLEASACAKPVIGGRSGGIPDAVIDGVTGLLVDPYAPEDIAGALTRLLTNRHLAIRLGQQGRSRVVRDFTWARVGSRVQDILDTVLREKSC